MSATKPSQERLKEIAAEAIENFIELSLEDWIEEGDDYTDEEKGAFRNCLVTFKIVSVEKIPEVVI